MQIRIPPKRIREEFRLVYELRGAQKAVNYLAKYYGVRKMRIILNGRKVGRGCEAVYYSNKAFFTKQGLFRENILHEFYHHLVNATGSELSERVEEKEANTFSREF